MKNHLKHLLFLGQSIALSLFFFWLTRLIFLHFTFDQFPLVFEDGIWGLMLQGARFDLSAIAYLNIIFILLSLIPTRKRENKGFQTVLKSLFLFFNGLALFLNLSDIVNVQFTGKRMTAGIFSFLSQGDDANNVAGDFIKDNWFLFLIFFILMLTLYQSFSFIQKKQFFLNRSKNNWKSYLLSLFCVLLTVLAMRGGTQLRPIKNIHASYYGQGKYVPLIVNTPFSILSTISEKGISEKMYFSNKEAQLYFNSAKSFKADSVLEKNVVVIILESFAKEYIGAYNNFKGYTPFLDSLMKHSIVCENAYANGKKSIEGIPAVLSGIPALSEDPFILSQYGAQKGNSIASVLGNYAYNSSFYHGGHPGTMGFDAYAEIADFDSYVDLSDYPNSDVDYDGKWGIFDEPFLQFLKTELDEKAEPFFSTVFTLSSHHPYTIPLQYKDQFPKGDLAIHESIGYSDFSLKRFFDEAKNSDWYNNTVFVITADHTFKSTHKAYQNSKGLYAIPLIIYEPSVNAFSSITKVCQQTDVLPTIIDYLQIDTSIVCFGNSVFDSTGFAVNYLNNIYQFFEDDYLLQFNGVESLALYNTTEDSLLSNSLLDENKQLALKMENQLKAIIQSYNYRMIHNQLELND
jgi:phosphoglycerol transferase MdoB-like AlkP superfamily enzyme